MCGFVGFANLEKNLLENIHIIKDMNLKLQKKGLEEKSYFFNENINLAYRRFIIADVKNRKTANEYKI